LIIEEIESKSDNNDEEKSPFEDVSDDDVEYLAKGESLMIR
jgi:hypothetical protein